MGAKENSKPTDKLIFPGSMLSVIQHTLALASLPCVFIFNFPLGLLLFVFPNDTHPSAHLPRPQGVWCENYLQTETATGIVRVAERRSFRFKFSLFAHMFLIMKCPTSGGRERGKREREVVAMFCYLFVVVFISFTVTVAVTVEVAATETAAQAKSPWNEACTRAA